MAGDRQNIGFMSAAVRLADEVQKRPFAAAAIVGGAAAATAGAFIGARALARRNGATDGHPVNSVLGTAITACEAAAAARDDGRGD
ncbi:hypothetical protein [Sphingosinicella rhizophila]|uniref:Uncharacterized protein n=1 Tax=Sphingosinicella rhizophila TaxID=3050082 RepID=A0ABU3Q2H2_9SPHN|nr:hypothetical protein [Sphingosinicella sp. GR2756]MDT9597584.1 hypothetical protein [Sphingosinicella sp. GR2756]